MDPDRTGDADAAGLQRERDLYLRLLELGHQTTLAPFLQQALALLVDLTAAKEAYLELYDDEDRPEGPRWWTARGLSGDRIGDVRATISRGIIAEAVASGRTVITPAALLDPRFSHRESVRVAGIQAVLCAPIGSDRPRGVLYLTGTAYGQSFSEDHRQCVELVTRHLAPLVDRLLAQQRRDEAEDPTRPWREMLGLDGLVGRSQAMGAVLREVAIAAPSCKNVLLIGQTGTGKSLLARIIHDNGPRAMGPFVEVNCTAIPDALVESELFGAKRTAATGIDRDRIGLVAQAEGGTLFLDEIGDIPYAAQGKLLQLLHSKQYTPLAGRAVRGDVRIIAGTNVDLGQAVAEKRFRQDLLYRLDVITIRMPSLAERREDIAELAATFCAEACKSEGYPPRTLSSDALRAIQATEWPGNVRQLEHAIQHGVLRACFEGATQVERLHLFPDAAAGSANPDAPATFQDATRRFHKRFIEEALDASDGNVSETARRIDLSRAHLYDLMRGLGIDHRR
jgi:DNA-binding NtrC family response regulator